jgi:hypothetical protein
VTASISRKLYGWVLLLYPKPFRDEFTDEMQSMFAECRAVQGFWYVLADVLLSAAKQQISYLSRPAPKNPLLYPEIAWSPHLARILAVSVLCLVLIASALVGRQKSEARDSWHRPCASGRVAPNQIILQTIRIKPGHSGRGE